GGGGVIEDCSQPASGIRRQVRTGEELAGVLRAGGRREREENDREDGRGPTRESTRTRQHTHHGDTTSLDRYRSLGVTAPAVERRLGKRCTTPVRRSGFHADNPAGRPGTRCAQP